MYVKKTTKMVTSIFAIAIASIFISQYTSPANSNSTGAPSGACGDPMGGNLTCAQPGCHTGLAVISKTGWITSDIPSSGYIPGTTYVITATATGTSSNKFGFEVSPQNSSGTSLGSLAISDAANTQLIGNSKYVTHKSAGTTGSTGSHTWSFNWIAPIGGSSGPVTFYGAFVIANNDEDHTGDTVRTSKLTIPQDPSTGITDVNKVSEGINVFPNPVNDLLTITNNKDSETMLLTIINTEGEIVKNLQVISNQPITATDLASGYYVLRIKTRSGTSIQKIIKN